MKSLLLLAAIAAIGFGASADAAGAPKVPVYIASAVADPARPDADRARDADRKPA